MVTDSASLVMLAAFVLVILIALLTGTLSYWFKTPADWLKRISAQMIGALVMAVLVGLVINAVETRQAENDQAALKSQLVIQLGSLDNARAIEAARLLDSQGWLHDGSLRGANLQNANLQGARFDNADLREVYLYSANLQGVILIVVDLQNANLFNADLRGARLYNANLVGADLTEAIFDENTLLPDLSYWMPDTDMTRFTNPQNPDFWHPSELLGPPWWAGNLAENLRGATVVPPTPHLSPCSSLYPQPSVLKS